MEGKAIKVIVAMILTLTMVTMTGCQTIESIVDSGKVIKDILDPSIDVNEETVKDLIGLDNQNSKKIVKEILDLARTYYEFSYPLIEDNISDLKLKLPSKPDFNRKSIDKTKSNDLAELSAKSALTMSMSNFSIASGAVALAYDPGSALAAHNLAAAIRISMERTNLEIFTHENLHPLEDSAALYLYSIALEPEIVDSYLNLGYIFMEMAGQEEKIAKTPYFTLDLSKKQLLDQTKMLFERALQIDNENLQANRGMADYYYAKGNRDKWLEWLLKSSEGVTFHKNTQKKTEDIRKIAEENKGLSEEAAKEAIDRLSQIEVFTTADYFDEIDPMIATAIREIMKTMPKDDMSFSISPKPYASEVTSYEIFDKQHLSGAWSIMIELEKVYITGMIVFIMKKKH
ncbi:MAG: hypothetical protein WDA24_09645 [Tissierellales bacterium]